MIWFPASGILTSPLIKLPLVLACTTVTSFAQTSPNPPATKEEVDSYGGKSDILSTGGSVKIAALMYRVRTYFGTYARDPLRV